MNVRAKIKEIDEKKRNAKQVDEKDVKTMLFCDEEDEYEFYDSTEEFLNVYVKEYLDNPDAYFIIDLPDRLWVSKRVQLKLNAYDVLYNVIKEFGLDDPDYIVESCDIAGLQKLLDEYAEKQSLDIFGHEYLEYVSIKDAVQELIDALHVLGK